MAQGVGITHLLQQVDGVSENLKRDIKSLDKLRQNILSVYACYETNQSEVRVVSVPQKTRKEILRRDNYTCCICKSREELEVHHKDKDWKNNCDSNLVTLCKPCHTHTHTKPDTTDD